ncbi:hypothetical protein HII36_29780 [Nonomuraea sp. NN258]|uniref:phage minor capsid protein n=1 Tax=Nonomuraea antri TaxID=2730852 RepID=UPI001568C1BE|nr:phage minor capsid protein [Nonomuraea antri]NRQ35991.1 hypothetical protein [Nonomuraea antri]
MAVSEQQLDQIAATVADLYRRVELATVRAVTARLRDGLAANPLQDKADALAKLRRAAQTILAALSSSAGPAIRQAVAAAYAAGYGGALTGLPEGWFPRSGIGQDARAASEVAPNIATIEAIARAVHTDLGHVSRNILRDMLDAYRAVQVESAARIASGAFTRRQAAQAVWQRLVDKGITDFVDSAGRRWRLSSYAEMVTRTNVKRAAVEAQNHRLAEVGLELVYVQDVVQECRLCLVPGTVVEGPVPTWRTRSEYTGDVISITTASGKNLTGTPDHPVLTAAGWRALKDLQPGDQVISHNGEQRYPGVMPDDVQVPTLIEEAGKTRAPLLLAGPTRRDLDRNIAYREIRAVFPNEGLLPEDGAALCEPVRDLSLIDRIGARSTLFGQSDGLAYLAGPGPAGVGLVHGVEHLGALFGSGIAPALEHGLPGHGGALVMGQFGHVADDAVVLGPGLDACSSQVVGDSAVADFIGDAEVRDGLPVLVAGDKVGGLLVAEFAGALAIRGYLDSTRGEMGDDLPMADVEGGHELLNRLAGTVALDEIVNVDVRHYSGHVWDLSTEPAWFIANGIVTHNCRPFEGKVLSIGPDARSGKIKFEHMIEDDVFIEVDVVATLDEARARGLHHPNCRHSISAYLPGVTKLPTNTADPKGNAARVRQRAIEREIRKYKERVAAALTPDAQQAAAERVRAWQQIMRDHLAANPTLKRLPYREQIGGGNTPGKRGPEGGAVGDVSPPQQGSALDLLPPDLRGPI